MLCLPCGSLQLLTLLHTALHMLCFMYALQLGADYVSIFHDNTGFCGTGYFFYNNPKYATSDVYRGCWNGYTLAHELGHNQGKSTVGLMTQIPAPQPPLFAMRG